jgi:hypothetical protein
MAKRYSHRKGVQVLILLRTLALNLQRTTSAQCAAGLASALQERSDLTFTQPWAKAERWDQRCRRTTGSSMAAPDPLQLTFSRS